MVKPGEIQKRQVTTVAEGLQGLITGVKVRGGGQPGQEAKVVVGTNQARDFKGKTTPFRISNGKSALWNSIIVLKDDTIIALTTTNQF